MQVVAPRALEQIFIPFMWHTTLGWPGLDNHELNNPDNVSPSKSCLRGLAVIEAPIFWQYQQTAIKISSSTV
jgi:hypothetical protein